MQMNLFRHFMFENYMKIQLLSIQLNLNAMYLPRRFLYKTSIFESKS